MALLLKYPRSCAGALALFLATLTLALYWPVGRFDLIYFDDPVMLTDSPQVRAGLTWPGIQWACTEVVIANWNPLTSLSFLAVAQCFGTAPGPHHLANALLHAANAGLLFWLLWRLTGATWRSALAAAMFAWHPLRVESVAWITERKDVLCGFFFLLSLLAYVRYAQATRDGSQESGARSQEINGDAKKSGTENRQSAIRNYWLSLIFFALALLSKPMAVTLPFVLLLLDFWPLSRIPVSGFSFASLAPWRFYSSFRFQVSGFKFPLSAFSFPLLPARFQVSGFRFQVLLEKLPFFALMLLFSVATYCFQHGGGVTTSWEVLGLGSRVANAIAGYVAYLGKLFWPVDLAAIYPYPHSFDPVQTGLKAALLLTISLGCVWQLPRRPQLALGWLWYLGTAVPIIGLVQVGEQSMADRYTYLPLIGPVVALVWTLAAEADRARWSRFVFIVLAITSLLALAGQTHRQLSYWRNTITLFAHNVAVTPGNATAHYILGLGYEHAGDTNRAITCYRVAKNISPAAWDDRRNLLSLLQKQGHGAAAEAECLALIAEQPDDFRNHLVLAGLLGGQGQEAEVLDQLNEAVRLNPDSVEALNNLAWLLATSPHPDFRDGPRAVTLARHACELTQFAKTIYIGTLGAAYAEAGQFAEAVTTAQRACDLAAKNGEQSLLQRNQELLECYQAHQSYRQVR